MIAIAMEKSRSKTGKRWTRRAVAALIVLAAAIVPLILVTLSRALRAKYDKHRRIARWTMPLWLYVSVTGVVIYVMLYRL